MFRSCDDGVDGESAVGLAAEPCLGGFVELRECSFDEADHGARCAGERPPLRAGVVLGDEMHVTVGEVGVVLGVEHVALLDRASQPGRQFVVRAGCVSERLTTPVARLGLVRHGGSDLSTADAGVGECHFWTPVLDLMGTALN